MAVECGVRKENVDALSNDSIHHNFLSRSFCGYVRNKTKNFYTKKEFLPLTSTMGNTSYLTVFSSARQKKN
jgi:hypothetical protein